MFKPINQNVTHLLYFFIAISERLGLARQKVLKTWRILAIISMIVAFAAFGIGLGQSVTSDKFPFGFGIPMIAALMVRACRVSCFK